MSRGPISPVTVALDPGAAAWALRHRIRRVADALGATPLDPLIPVSGPFEIVGGSGLAAVRAAVEAAVPVVPYIACDLDGYAARSSGTGGTIGVEVRPSAGLRATAASLDRLLLEIADAGDPPCERFLVPAVRLPGRAEFTTAARALGLAPLPWYHLLLRLFRTSAPAPRLPPVHRPLDATRLLILVGDRPVAGLDLGPRRWLRAAELRDRSLRAASLRAYRLARGYELAGPAAGPPGETWFLADLHLGHPEIALYCARPFLGADVEEQSRVLLQNWNRTVRPEDRALVLGDLCASSDPGAYRSAVSRLSGRLELVQGNHDPVLPGLVPSVMLEADGQRFLALHDPADAPPGFDGWVIHGHLHDADLVRYPFFDPVGRRVNVSVETAGYAPVPLSLIRRLIRERAGRVTLRETGPA